MQNKMKSRFRAKNKNEAQKIRNRAKKLCIFSWSGAKMH